MKGGKMKKPKKSILVLAVMVAFICKGLFLPGLVVAGDLDQTAQPDDAVGAMYTLEDIYNRLKDRTPATKRGAGQFKEPPAIPGSTVPTLDQIYDLAIPTKVEKTAQIYPSSVATGDDGALKKGVKYPDVRFTSNGNGTTTDNLTGLIWLHNADCFGVKTWENALTACNSLSDGSCELTDNSIAGDWRLPNIKELQSLIDYGVVNPAVKSGRRVQCATGHYYWSSTTHASSYAWYVDFCTGRAGYSAKTLFNYYHVWPVKGGRQ
jgi:hypothetical protein